MGKVTVATKLKKVSEFVDNQGNIIQTSGADRFKQAQEARARRLGLKK